MATSSSSSRSIRLQPQFLCIQKLSLQHVQCRPLLRQRGDICGHWRVRNRICSRAILGAMTSWRHRRLRSSWPQDVSHCPLKVSKSDSDHATLLQARANFSDSSATGIIRLASRHALPIPNLCTKMICTRRSGHSSGHFDSWPVDKHIATDSRDADLASTHLSASLASRSIYICGV
jgi:hypothetical protein